MARSLKALLYDRARQHDDKRKLSKRRHRKAYRQRHPLKVKAWNLFNNALRRGEVTRQACEVCGGTDGLQAHHENYRWPLKVRWLCREHHRMVTYV